MFLVSTRRGNVFRRVRQRLTYGNVTATAALFVALGGTSYAALTLPKNSIGSRELRPKSVGTSELKTGAVRSTDIKDRTIAVRDISKGARRELQGTPGPVGPPGPPGPTFFAVVNSAGSVVSGNSTSSIPRGINGRTLTFPRSVAGCAYAATPARVEGGLVVDPPPGSSATVAADNGGLLVQTWDQNNQPKALPFHLIVAC
jgi:hypothetical protein